MYLQVTYLPGSVASPYHPPSFPAIGRLTITVWAFLPSAKRRDSVIGWSGGSVGIGHFFILWIMASDLGAPKSIAPCEATKSGKYVT